jgi:hypothetical protein
VIVRPYTSGTMQVGWRYELESKYKELIRETIAAKWLPVKVPENYSRPRQDIDHLVGRVVWLHPRATVSVRDGDRAARAGFYIPRNLRLIHDCDFVLSCIYPNYPSIDSAHEVGAAYAWSKPIVTVDLTGGAGDYAAWRAMSLVVLDSLEAAADYLLYQVQDNDDITMQLNQTTVGDKLPV